MNEADSNLILNFVSTGNYVKALQLIRRNLSVDPEDYFSNYHAGFCQRFLGNLDEAIQHYTVAARVKPEMAPAQLGLGIAFQLSGNFDAALEALHRAIKLNPNLIEAYNSLGLTYKKLNQLRRALECYQSGIDRVWDSVQEKVHERSELCYQIDQNGRRTVLPFVFTETQRLLKSNAIYAVLCNNAGVCLNLLGDSEQARSRFEESIDCTPDGYDYREPVDNLKNLA